MGGKALKIYMTGRVLILWSLLHQDTIHLSGQMYVKEWGGVRTDKMEPESGRTTQTELSQYPETVLPLL